MTAMSEGRTLLAALMRLDQIGFATFSTDVGYAIVKFNGNGDVAELDLFHYHHP